MTEVTPEPCSTDVTGFPVGAGKKTEVTPPVPWTTEVTIPSGTLRKMTEVIPSVPPMAEVTALPSWTTEVTGLPTEVKTELTT